MNDLQIEENAKNFFTAIDMYTLKDLEKMLECVDYTHSHQRLAVPIALTCFSLLDIVGFLIRDIDTMNIEGEQPESKNCSNTYNHSNPLKDTKANLECSLKYFFGEEIKQLERDRLINLYRHGIIHSSFPKNSGIHNSPERKEIITSSGILDFNVNPFCKILINKFRDKFKILLDTPKREIILSNFIKYQEDTNAQSLKYSNGITKSANQGPENPTTTVQQPR
jgi:hypothetical protein